ncbi:Ankyrin repeat [Ostreococcus tauri]|uniref:Ankyrin repeat n=1 Tax=Ostreococcus tauri TaxID=70448 RepID=A0A096P8D8_OSTTA|nr:Ankyrin repeat [Ostreococcus tauri]OUS45316.1 ankyrin repeat-containing domain protein [Ostreococcus tauri]CEG00515.1 Ankyrin repeat [Ostreococcus tauri]|eukprot:XP_022840417.1 Ankyrin repeat [Ostreococcus tauri]
MSGQETEIEPWYKRVKGPFPETYGCVGVKADGGGSMRGRGTVGTMRVHRATFNRDEAKIRALVEAGDSVNEVDAAGSTPIMCAAYEGWVRGIDVLVELGAKVNASNNAGDTAYHWAQNMDWKDIMERLKHHGADPEYLGQVIVPEHIPKVKDFYDGDEGQEHPKPSQEFLDYQNERDRQMQDATDNALLI